MANGKKIGLTILLLCYSLLLYAQNIDEHYIRIIEPNRERINKVVTRIVSIDKISGDTLYAYSNSTGLARLTKLGYKIDELVRPSLRSRKAVVMACDINQMENWDRYPTYDVYRAMLKKYEQTYPSLCKLDSIGTTVKGRKLYVVKISDNVASTDYSEPEVFLTSTMHGDETTGYVLMLRLIDSLLTGYSSSATIKNMVDNLAIYINPNANPDGTYYRGNDTITGATRFNGNFVDLNRNFPDPRAGNHPDGHSWQPETSAMMEFARNHHFVLSANFHGGIEVANYPWDTWTSSENLHADNDWFLALCRMYADSVHAHSPSFYFDDLNNGVTNGGDWYVVAGGRQDYMNYWHRCREITLEISSVKLLSSDLLPDHWRYNRAALLALINRAQYGFYGTVTNSSDEPLNASVTILNHDRFNSTVTTTSGGTYFRPTKPGTYSLYCSADGYKSKQLDNVTIGKNERIAVNFQLEPDTDPHPSAESFEETIPEAIHPDSAPWIRETGTANSGNYSLKSPAIANSQKSAFTIELETTQTGEISFARKTSSEAGYDCLRFYIDNTLQGAWSGETDWETFQFPVTAGKHTFKWEYGKDNETSAGADCAWIDDISFPPCNKAITLDVLINNNRYEGLTVHCNGNNLSTLSDGTVTYSSIPTNSTFTVTVKSEAQALGEQPTSTTWQQDHYPIELTALFDVVLHVNHNNNPIEGASVSIDQGTPATTDNNGNASFSDIPFSQSANYTISKDGYEEQGGNIRIASDSTYTLSIYATVSPVTRTDRVTLSVYPNPFGSKLTIRVETPNPLQNATLKLTRIDGTPAATIYTGRLNAGRNTISWTPNRVSPTLSPGIYLLMLTHNGTTLTKKLLHTTDN